VCRICSDSISWFGLLSISVGLSVLDWNFCKTASTCCIEYNGASLSSNSAWLFAIFAGVTFCLWLAPGCGLLNVAYNCAIFLICSSLVIGVIPSTSEWHNYLLSQMWLVYCLGAFTNSGWLSFNWNLCRKTTLRYHCNDSTYRSLYYALLRHCESQVHSKIELSLLLSGPLGPDNWSKGWRCAVASLQEWLE
jgi:hypothetical protein